MCIVGLRRKRLANNAIRSLALGLDAILLCEAERLPPLESRSTMEMMMGRQTRIRQQCIKVWVDEREKGQIEDNAKGCNHSASSFLRNLGVGYTPKSMIDHKAVGDLMQLNGDLGRLGGLLKMLLSNEQGFVGHEDKMEEVSSLLSGFNDLRNEIREKVRYL